MTITGIKVVEKPKTWVWCDRTDCMFCGDFDKCTREEITINSGCRCVSYKKKVDVATVYREAEEIKKEMGGDNGKD